MKDLSVVLEEDILKPSSRKLTFLYLNLCDPDQRRICVGSAPAEVLFGNPEEALAIIEWKDQERFDKFWKGFSEGLELGQYRDSGPIFNLGILSALIKKHKGDLSSIKKELIVIYEPIGKERKLKTIYLVDEKNEKKNLATCLHHEDFDRLFLVKEELVGRIILSNIIESKIRVVHTKELSNKQSSILTVEIGEQGSVCKEKNCLVMRGVELLNDKKPYHSRLLFWFEESEKYFRVGGYLESPTITMLATRTNATIIA